jgi:hypothetical protein
MARTRTAPWDYARPEPTLAQLEDNDIYIQYCQILNRLERDYGVDRVTAIAIPWRGLSNPEKLMRAQVLEIELDATRNGNVALFQTGNTGNVNIYGRKYLRVTRSSWKRIRKLCSGHAILPGVWAYYVPRLKPIGG